ncbi:hypothetical protein HK100_010747 [Physocladia obscura]|uniref:Ankyrin n=1 Tax=Physocladia obscura TaxID=109957 RepID=A0AAD5XEK5_9FUNG|nr:hypothetical protein HK100_010747 [Physocladia obscura]
MIPLPFEIRVIILIKLPVDAHLLSLALVGKGFLDDLILYDLSTAKAHCAAHQKYQNDELDATIWSSLPLLYRSASLAYKSLWLDLNKITFVDLSAAMIPALQALLCHDKFNHEFSPAMVDWIPWSWACSQGHSNVLELLLQYPVTDECVEASLFNAVEFGHLSIVQLIVTKKHIAKTQLALAFLHAIKKYHLNIARYLLLETAINFPSEIASESLIGVCSIPLNHTSALTIITEIAAALIANPVTNLGLSNPTTLNPFVLSATKGHVAVVRMFLSNPLMNDPQIRHIPGILRQSADALCIAFIHAVQNKHMEIVLLLLADPRVDPTIWNNFALVCAAEFGHADIVSLLLQDPRVDPSARKNESLYYACKNGHISIVKLLLANPQSDPDAENNLAIKTAVFNNRKKIVELLIADPRVDASDSDNEALKDAKTFKYFEIAQILMGDSRVAALSEKQKRQGPSAQSPTAISSTSGRKRNKAMKKNNPGVMIH